MVPSEAAQRELREKMEAARPAPKGNLWLKRALPLAACLLLVAGAAWAYQQLRDPSGIAPPTTAAPMQYGGEVAGLPVRRELLRDMPSTGAMADRQPFFTLRDFFLNGDMKTFVLARVTGTKSLPPGYVYGSDRQRATLEVLEWDFFPLDAPEYPVTVTLIQNRLGGCTMEEQTNLLRPGGVYLLPLRYYEDEYYLMGDLDVLFEVDEQGNIYSHSDFEDFAAYDGKPWETLMEDMRAIVRDDPLLPAYPQLYRMLHSSMSLVEITVTGSETAAKDENGYPLTNRQAQKERTLFQGGQGELPGQFTLTAREENIATQPGERYLLFIDCYEGQFIMEAGRAAKVNDDGAITPLISTWAPRHALAELAGMTVEQVQALIGKAG
jgi:hypothetical protein